LINFASVLIQDLQRNFWQEYDITVLLLPCSSFS